MKSKDIAIIGGGAAGFFAAVTAKQYNPQARVTILERRKDVLAKVLVTGGGRCNLTNTFALISDLKQAYPRGSKLMKRLFKQFDCHDTWQWFEDRGLSLVAQDDECVFPVSQNAADVVECLTSEARCLGVKVKVNQRLTAITPLDGGRIGLVCEDGSAADYDSVVVATGSPTAAFMQLFASLGHKTEVPVPSLFTFNISESGLHQLMGVVVEARLSIPSTRLKSQGNMLVTHWGLSGPCALKLSSYAARHLAECDYKSPLAVDWTNGRSRAEVEETLSQLSVSNPQKQMGTLRPFDLPSGLWQYLLQRTSLRTDRKWAELGRKGMNQLIETLTNDVYHIDGRGVFKKEFVTCGGIALGNIDANTMESKVCPNMYFAGEVLDVDAITGGFNLQAAWTMGYVAGKNAALKE